MTMVVVSVTPVRAPSLNLRVMLSALLSARLVKVATPGGAEMERSLQRAGACSQGRGRRCWMLVVMMLPKESST